MQPQSIHRKLIDRVLSKVNDPNTQPNITLKALSSFANNVYKVTVGEDQNGQIANKSFLLKIYRQYLSQFSNKPIENQVVKILSEHDLYPHVYFSDKNYRIEDFIEGFAPGVQNITKQQMIDIMNKLAKMVEVFKNYAQQKSQAYANQRRIKQMFELFGQMVKYCQKQHPEAYQICRKYTDLIMSQQIRTNLQKIVPKQMVPTHNDCHFHNVLIRNKDKRLFLIDYQFFCPNYRGFQLGNFFNEYATDYHTFQIKQELELAQPTKDQLIKVYYSQVAPKLSAQEAKQQVQVGRLLSHLFWLFIGVKQVKDPKITIDMQYYIKRRYEQFMKIYNALVKRSQPK